MQPVCLNLNMNIKVQYKNFFHKVMTEQITKEGKEDGISTEESPLTDVSHQKDP
jgi:hypothetical protein